MACGIFPWSGIKPGSPALRTQSLSHWTTRGVLYLYILIVIDLCFSPYMLVDWVLHWSSVLLLSSLLTLPLEDGVGGPWMEVALAAALWVPSFHLEEDTVESDDLRVPNILVFPSLCDFTAYKCSLWIGVPRIQSRVWHQGLQKGRPDLQKLGPSLGVRFLTCIQ